MNLARNLLMPVLLVFSLTSLCFSQTSSASLQGTVSDATGGAIAGAAVALLNTGSNLERSATTGNLGEYRFLALPPGVYRLAVTAKGFARYQQTDLQLLVNTPATANVQLKVGGTSEVVNVSGEAPALRSRRVMSARNSFLHTLRNSLRA